MSQARGRSPFGLLVAILVSLVLGAAAGYGAMRYFTLQDADRLATVDAQIADLSAKLDDSNRRLAEALDARRQAETALDAGDPQTAALRQTLASQRGELDAMADTLEATSRELLSEKDENARLAKALAESRQHGLAQDQAIETAKRDATNARQAADAALADLRQRLDASEGEAGKALAALKTVEIPRLEAEVAALSDKLAEAEADGAKVAAELTRSRDALRDAEGRLGRSQDALKDAADKLAREQARSAGLQAELDASRAQSAPDEDKAPDNAPAAPPEATEDLPLVADAPRDAATVDAVLARTPGLDRLSAEDYQRLRSMLVSGECVTTGLQSVFRSVPVVTLRNLMRDLKSGC